MAGWIKKVVERKNSIETVQFYAELSTNCLIFRTSSVHIRFDLERYLLIISLLCLPGTPYTSEVTSICVDNQKCVLSCVIN